MTPNAYDMPRTAVLGPIEHPWILVLEGHSPQRSVYKEFADHSPWARSGPPPVLDSAQAKNGFHILKR